VLPNVFGILLPTTMPTQVARRKARELDHAAYPDSSNSLLGCPRSVLLLDNPYLARPDRAARSFGPGNKRKEVGESVRAGGKHDNADFEACKILLIPQILVRGDEDIEACCGSSEQVAVLEA
jgi:hypothetical protein